MLFDENGKRTLKMDKACTAVIDCRIKSNQMRSFFCHYYYLLNVKIHNVYFIIQLIGLPHKAHFLFYLIYLIKMLELGYLCVENSFLYFTFATTIRDGDKNIGMQNWV